MNTNGINEAALEKPITLAQARELLNNISEPVLRRWIRERKVRHHRSGRTYYFFASEVIEDLKKM
jgi:excisionase family DNA binding protein